MRRYMMGAATSLMVIALLWVAYWVGGLSWSGLIQGTLLILFWIVLFYVMLRSGINLRLRDPSLTLPQLAASLLSIVYIMYYADGGRGALLVVYLLPFLFGVFRLRTMQLLKLAAVAVIAFGVMLLCLRRFKPATVEMADEVLELMVIAVALPWFAVMGGYVTRLRGEMREANRELASAKEAAEAADQAKSTFLATTIRDRGHRDRHPRGSSRPVVPVLQPGRRVNRAQVRRHRSRSRHQPTARRAPRRPYLGREHTGTRQPVRVHDSRIGGAA
jgi:hypothetical protein